MTFNNNPQELDEKNVENRRKKDKRKKGERQCYKGIKYARLYREIKRNEK